jgi:hypothetical protein
VLDGRYGSTSVRELFGYQPGWALPSTADRAAIVAIMRGPSVQTFPSTNV